MKKFASLLIALALVLTSVSALAAVVPSKTSSDVASVVSLDPTAFIEVVPYDFKAQAEVARIRDAYMAGKKVENCFNTAVATDIAGASDVLDIVAVKCYGETEAETVSAIITGAAPYTGNVACLLGIYDSALNLYNYETIPAECNEDGTATITLTIDQFNEAKAAESVTLTMIQL